MSAKQVTSKTVSNSSSITKKDVKEETKLGSKLSSIQEKL